MLPPGPDISPPPGCTQTLANGSLAQIHIVPGFGSTAGIFNVDYFATIAFESTVNGTYRCPGSQLRWMLGHSATDGYHNITLLSCTPYMESILVDASFQLPGYTIDDAKPPQPDESTAKPMGINASAAAIPAITPDNVLGYEDAFFQAVVWGRDGTPLEQLVGEENMARALERAEHTYRQIVAQNLNAYFRTAEGGAPEGSFVGTVTDGDRLRLVQNAVSTRILEGALLFMAVCAGLSFLLERETRILPRNPGSVGSAMGLFAGSELLQILAREAATVEGEKRLLGGELVDYRYRLGWWARGTDRERFGIDIERPGGEAVEQDDVTPNERSSGEHSV
ncbi:hypothetical protein SLS54_009847 [Diplodia seriata]